MKTQNTTTSNKPLAVPNTGNDTDCDCDCDRDRDEDVANVTTNNTDVAGDADEDEGYGYIECPIKDTAHSTIGGVNSDDEYEEFWEEETVDSTEEADDWSYRSWEEETIEDEGVVLEQHGEGEEVDED